MIPTAAALPIIAPREPRMRGDDPFIHSMDASHLQ